MYDQNGKSTGTALVHFQRVGDAALAYQKFNTVPLDGKPFAFVFVFAFVFIFSEVVTLSHNAYCSPLPIDL